MKEPTNVKRVWRLNHSALRVHVLAPKLAATAHIANAMEQSHSTDCVFFCGVRILATFPPAPSPGRRQDAAVAVG